MCKVQQGIRRGNSTFLQLKMYFYVFLELKTKNNNFSVYSLKDKMMWQNILNRSSSLTLKVCQSLNQVFLWNLTAPEDPLAVGHSSHHVSLTTSAAVSCIEQTDFLHARPAGGLDFSPKMWPEYRYQSASGWFTQRFERIISLGSVAKLPAAGPRITFPPSAGC